MLLRSAVQKNPSAIAHTQDENDTKNRQSSNFLGRKTTVSVKAGSSSQIFKGETAVNHHKRHISSTVSLSEASAVLLKNRFQIVLDKYSSYSLNKDFSRLIAQNTCDWELDIWIANGSGTFIREETIAAEKPVTSTRQHRADILFVPCLAKQHGRILTVYEKDPVKGLQKTQEITNYELLNCPPGDCHSNLNLPYYISNILFSDDGTSVACLTNDRGGVFLGRGPDNKWVNKGNCMEYEKLIFSQDSKHVAMAKFDQLCLMSKGPNGVWRETGRLCEEIGSWKMAFSSDNQHFIAWFNEDAQDDEDSDFRNDFFVVLFGLNHDNQWEEKTIISKYAPSHTEFYTLRAKFSPNGKHLVVCGREKFDIWDLDDSGEWTSILENIPYLNGDSIEGIKKPVINFAADSNRFTILAGTNGIIWGLQGNGLWGFQHAFSIDWELRPKISADGKAIICQDLLDDDEKGLWLEETPGNWLWHTLDFDFQNPLFHPVCNLLVLNDPTNNTLVFMGPSSDGEIWVEKGCLQLSGRVKLYNFSCDGRFLEVVSNDSDGHDVLSIWDIVANEPNTESKKRRYDLRPRLVK